MTQGFSIRASMVMLMGIACLAMPHHGVANDDLCPDVDSAKQAAPRNSDGMQASIERLNLCVERARLLKQLDDIAKQREDVLNKIANPGVDANSLSGIPSLSGSALPPLPTDVSGLKPGDVKITGAAGNPFESGNVSASAPVIKRASWKVRKIWGQGDTMRAQISDGATLLNVVRGDVMPDDGVVESVSVRGVAVSYKGKVSELPWDDAGASTAVK